MASESDVDALILHLAKNHPEYSVEQFISDFKNTVGRDPVVAEKLKYQKSVADAKENQQEIFINYYLRLEESSSIVKQSSIGLQCSFPNVDYERTIFMNYVITEGIYHWKIKIQYGTHQYSTLAIGSVPERAATLAGEMALGTSMAKERGFVAGDGSEGSTVEKSVSCAPAFSFRRGPDGTLESSLLGVDVGGTINPKENPVPNGSVVGVEVNCDAQTLSFFVNNNRVPWTVSKIRVPLQLGVTGRRDASFTSVSFRRLSAPTPSAVEPVLLANR